MQVTAFQYSHGRAVFTYWDKCRNDMFVRCVVSIGSARCELHSYIRSSAGCSPSGLHR